MSSNLKAYAVSIVFGSGPIIANTVVGPSPEFAAALLMQAAMRNPPEGGVPDLTGVAVMPLSEEWLRWALRMVESGDAKAPVVQLVQKDPETEDAPSTKSRWAAAFDSLRAPPPSDDPA